LVFTRTIVARGSTKPTNIELWLMNADTSEARRLTHESLDRPGGQPGSQDNYAGWSPDGTQVVFTHWEHGIHGNPDQFAIETIKPDGTGRRQVTPNDINAGEPAWSPDGTLIAFQSPPDDEGMIRDLYTIRPDGTEISTLTSNMDANDSDHPTWSPDSSRIVFSHVRPGSTTGADLYVVNRDGSRPHPVAATPLNETAPSWSVAPS
jgi:Tol biopolymer transport system component